MESSTTISSSLNNLLDEAEADRENADFFLQKCRIEEVLEELLNDLGALGRIGMCLQTEAGYGKTLWEKMKEASENRTEYDAFTKLLREIDKHVSHDASQKGTIPPLLDDLLKKVRDVAEKSLLRPPSPPVVIKNRAEQETFRWARLITLQQSEMDSLKRKIVEYEQKIVDRKNERRELQLRSSREMAEQLNASHTALTEIGRVGDGIARRLQEEISGQPQLENTPEYRSSLDQADQKRKRIAKLHVQLQLWIKKYDKFIGEPMQPLIELETRMAGLEEWIENVQKPQEDRLQELREQVGEYEAIALEEKVEEFRKLHAVRVLQRAWKQTLAIKLSKKQKKSKKGKGKKKK